MLRILGSFKVVPDLELLSEDDWIVKEDNLVDTSFVKTVWNCFDESALELMLKLSDSSESFGVTIQLDAITVGNDIGDKYLKTLYALGFERAVRIKAEEELQFQPELTARLIAEYWSRYGGQDVIVMGQKSADGENGKIPLLVAEELGWPCITQVLGFQLIDEEYLNVTYLMDDCEGNQMVKLPCVLSVGDTPSSYLRIPTLKDRMTKGKRSVEHLELDEFECWKQRNMKENNVTLMELSPVFHNRNGKFVEGDTIKEKVEVLYESYLKERLERL